MYLSYLKVVLYYYHCYYLLCAPPCGNASLVPKGCLEEIALKNWQKANSVIHSNKKIKGIIIRNVLHINDYYYYYYLASATM